MRPGSVSVPRYSRMSSALRLLARVGSRALVAEILAVDSAKYRQRFNLNRGFVDGVFVGQALIDAQGVVGQVMSVGPFTSEAVLITDADHAVPVTVNRSRVRTNAFGTGESQRLRLNLTNNADIEVGDLLVSSGLGGVFPQGYPVGRVIEVRLRPDQAFAEILAEPVSELDRDREVLLVWDEDADGESDAEEAAAASVAEGQ